MSIAPERLPYRPDIDGLRAVAVLSVVLFHAGLGLTGGYVGVDIFFVISGFLITSIIARDLAQNRFSLLQFWTRRIRRIVPAAMTMVVFFAVTGYFLLLPFDFEEIMRSALWHTGMLANLFFRLDVGYFAEQAELKPLLHTWSLAVEEQFYLLVPPLLLLYWRRVSQKLLPALLVAAAISLLCCVWQTSADPSSAFFLLPARAWELLAGAALAVAPLERLKSRRFAEMLTLSGAAMILAAVFLFDQQTPFPGTAALLPVFGAVAVIAGGMHHVTRVSRLLSWSPVVQIGRMSYSIYLWHWPLFSFAHLLLIEVSTEIRCTLAVASILISVPSYYWIEQPCRRGPWLATPQRSFRFAFAIAIVMVITSVITLKCDGFPSRVSEAMRTIVEDVEWRGQEYACKENRPVPLGIAPETERTPDFVLWGDSHARVLCQLFDEQAAAHQLYGQCYNRSSTIPVPGVWKASQPQDREEFLAFNQLVQERLLHSEVPLVILVSRWTLYSSGLDPAEIALGQPPFGDLVVDGMIDRQAVEPPTPAMAAAAMERQLRALLQRLTAAGKQVWILRQVPEMLRIAPARDFYIAELFPSANQSAFAALPAATLAMHQQRQALANQVLSSVTMPGVTLLDPSAPFFNEQGELQGYSERSHYVDNDHVTRFGAEKFLEPVVRNILQAARQEKMAREARRQHGGSLVQHATAAATARRD